MSAYLKVTATTVVCTREEGDPEPSEAYARYLACREAGLKLLQLAFRYRDGGQRPYVGIDYPIVGFTSTVEESDNPGV